MDGAPGGYEAAHPVTKPGSTRDGMSILRTGLTSQSRVTDWATIQRPPRADHEISHDHPAKTHGRLRTVAAIAGPAHLAHMTYSPLGKSAAQAGIPWSTKNSRALYAG